MLFQAHPCVRAAQHTDGCFPSSRTLPNLWGVAAGDGHLGAHYITGDLVRKDGTVREAKKDMIPCVWEPTEGNEWTKRDDLA